MNYQLNPEPCSSLQLQVLQDALAQDTTVYDILALVPPVGNVEAG